MIPETSTTKAIVSVLCAYECVAIQTRLPTLTALHRRQPIVGTAIVAALVVHFFFSRPPEEA